MNYELESVDLAVNITGEASVTAQIEDAQPLAITVGDAAKIETGQAVTYIESGKAEIAAAVASGLAQITTVAADRNLSNLTATGTAKFTAKQDVIADLSTIRSGATAGATAVQPADLATVATSGSYNDLSNKPDLSGYAADNAVVHLTGAETITGEKTFSSNIDLTNSTQSYRHIYSVNSAVTKGTAPSANTGTDIVLRDSANSNIGAFTAWYNSNGNINIGLSAYTPTAGSTEYALFKVSNYGSGRADVQFSTPSGVTNSSMEYETNSTSSEIIPTMGWVNNPAVSTNVVHRSDAETISGEKTFTANMYQQMATPYFIISNTGADKGTAPAATQTWVVNFSDSRANGDLNKSFGRLQVTYYANKNVNTSLRAINYAANSNDSTEMFMWNNANGTKYTTINCIFRPSTDNSFNLGDSGYRWKQLYAGTTTIATSDERLKQGIESVPDAVLDAWGEVEFYRYKFNDAVAEKGFDNARYHTGVVAQRILQIFGEHGLNARDYGLLCYDEWAAEEELRDDEGNITRPAREAGNRYSVRYEECLCMEAAYQRRRADRIEARLAALEARV